MTAAAEIRAWADAHDYDVPARGKIPGHIVDAYVAAHDPAPDVESVPVAPAGAGVALEVLGTCRFEIGGIEYEVPMSIPVTWTPGGAS